MGKSKWYVDFNWETFKDYLRNEVELWNYPTKLSFSLKEWNSMPYLCKVDYVSHYGIDNIKIYDFKELGDEITYLTEEQIMESLK